MFRSFPIGLSLVIVAVHWAIPDNISALDPASDMMAPTYFEVGNSLKFLATCLYFFVSAVDVVSH